MESKLLGEIDEFLAFGTLLDEQGITTVEDFLGLARSSPEGVMALLEIDQDTLDTLVSVAMSRLTQEERKELKETEIKTVGEDYKMGLRTREE